jgi:hypothetical protein
VRGITRSITTGMHITDMPLPTIAGIIETRIAKGQ